MQIARIKLVIAQITNSLGYTVRGMSRLLGNAMSALVLVFALA